VSQPASQDHTEFQRLQFELAARERDISDMGEREDRQETLIARLRREAAVHEDHLAELHERVDAAEHELEDLRGIREALTPPELPQRPGLELAAAFLPAAERVSGDFYLTAEGPRDATVLAVGDVVGHGLTAGRRAAFVRTTFALTAPFSDDPRSLLTWANAALIERAGTSADFVTAACITYLPAERCLRWAYAGHPPAIWLDDGQELTAPKQGLPLGIGTDPECAGGELRATAGAGMLLYTDGLTEARRNGKRFGLDSVSAALFASLALDFAALRLRVAAAFFAAALR
jgi:sigma-B regulation protein RsbU (phosphoserine phosphatase)